MNICEDNINNNMSGNILTENNKVDSVFFTDDFSVKDNTFEDPIGSICHVRRICTVRKSGCGTKLVRCTYRPPETWNIEYTDVSHMSDSDLYKLSDAYHKLFGFDNSRLFCGDFKVSDDKYYKKFMNYMHYTLANSKNFYMKKITDEERKDAIKENQEFLSRLLYTSDINHVHEDFSSAVKFTKGLFINGEGPFATLSDFQKDAVEYFEEFSKGIIPYMQIKDIDAIG